MYRKQDEHLYSLLGLFLEKCVLSNDSILTNHSNCFTADNINDCITRFVENYKDDKRNYEGKIQEQFNGATDDVKVVFAHVNWLWAFSVDDMTAWGKKRAVQICLPPNVSLNDTRNGMPLFPADGFGSAGTYHKQNKYWEIVCILKILKHLKISAGANKLTTVDSLKSEIDKICLFAKYDESEEPAEDWQKDIRKIKNACAMYNILPYLCKPETYERITSDNHKRRIVDSFSSLLSPDDATKNTDQKIYSIRTAINQLIQKDFDFYEGQITVLWNPWLSDSEYNEIQGLSFKKNIILYGPPGTGKTFAAKWLAESFIIQKMIEKDKNKVKDYFEKKVDVSGRIRRLQLHSNYSYEDFIAGVTLKDGKTQSTKGYFYRLCEEIDSDNNKAPYVLILDEINRIDLSRLFGEAFSEIENRDEEIDLPVGGGGFKLKIPANLCIIGTMNEIDFSLERLDFALRRRFVWFRYGYNTDTLSSIVKSKRTLNPVELNDEDINTFIERATRLNGKIAELNELGKQYEIGHTFFAEIIDIASQFSGRPGYMRKVKLFKSGGPAEVLWNISLEPIIAAFLGNFDENQKNERIKEMREILVNGK